MRQMLECRLSATAMSAETALLQAPLSRRDARRATAWMQQGMAR
jgi:hypothetical protein